MRALAEFVMRGRPQAIGVSVLAAPLPLLHLLSTSVVALVWLRKGTTEGMLVLGWTCLPLLAIYTMAGVYGLRWDPGSFITLFATVAMAQTLRLTVSWHWVAPVAVGLAIAGTWVFVVMAPDALDLWVRFYVDFMRESLQQEIAPEDARHAVIGFFAMGQAWMTIGLLSLARWWQSQLYNPGGFGSEFHGLRLPPQLSAAIVLLMVGCVASDMPVLVRWLGVLTVPLALAGLGLVHWAAAYNRLSAPWLVGFYLMLFGLAQLVYPLVVAGALMDSWFDIRKRFETDREV